MSSARGRTVISSAAIRAAVNGDAQAIGSLSAHLDAAAGRMLSRLRVRSPGGRQVERDELRQEVMLRVVRNLPRFVDGSGGQLIDWLCRIVRNCHADTFDELAVRPDLPSLDCHPRPSRVRVCYPAAST